MKRNLIVIGLVLSGMVMVLGFYPLDTVHSSYRLLRAEADEDTDLLDLTTESNFGNLPTGKKQLATRPEDGAGHGGNGIEIIFAGGPAANKTFTYTIYAWRRLNGVARMVATGTGTLGTQAVVAYPHNAATATSKFWADTLTVTGRWLNTVWTTDSAGNNECASIQFDGCGYEYLYVEITNADGVTGTEAANVSAYYAWW